MLGVVLTIHPIIHPSMIRVYHSNNTVMFFFYIMLHIMLESLVLISFILYACLLEKHCRNTRLLALLMPCYRMCLTLIFSQLFWRNVALQVERLAYLNSLYIVSQNSQRAPRDIGAVWLEKCRLQSTWLMKLLEKRINKTWTKFDLLFTGAFTNVGSSNGLLIIFFKDNNQNPMLLDLLINRTLTMKPLFLTENVLISATFC